MRRQFAQPVINTALVDSLDDALEKTRAAGGKVVFGPQEIPNVGTHAYCEDPEGNLFGVVQEAGRVAANAPREGAADGARAPSPHNPRLLVIPAKAGTYPAPSVTLPLLRLPPDLPSVHLDAGGLGRVGRDSVN